MLHGLLNNFIIYTNKILLLLLLLLNKIFYWECQYINSNRVLLARWFRKSQTRYLIYNAPSNTYLLTWLIRKLNAHMEIFHFFFYEIARPMRKKVVTYCSLFSNVNLKYAAAKKCTAWFKVKRKKRNAKNNFLL